MRRIKRSLSLEWLLMSLGLLALVFWLSSPPQLSRANLWLKDISLSLPNNAPSSDVVLVLVDEPSLRSIGRWPWRRALHAHVIQQINAGQPQSIGLDFLLTEPDLDYPEDDLALATAIARSGRVVLPVARSFSGKTVDLPLPLFQDAAARLGHVHLPLDNDGGVRSFYAREGAGDQVWLHLGLSMLCLNQPDRPYCKSTNNAAQAEIQSAWKRLRRTHIAFAQGSPPFTMYSYIDVLNGNVPAEAFHNKHVLIGTAATGMGSTIATPSNGNHAVSYNAELVGHIISGSLQKQHAVSASTWANYAFNLIPVALALAALSVLGPSAALLTCIGLAVLIVAGQVAAAMLWQISFAPAAALLALAMAYPLWSWRRLSAAARFLRQEMQGLQLQGLMTNTPAPRAGGDFLQQHIAAVEHASQELRLLHQFVTETLLQLPSPTLACNSQGQILLANSAAHRYAESLGRTIEDKQAVSALLEGAVQRGSHKALWDPLHPPSLNHSEQLEGVDLHDNNLLLLSKPFTVSGNTGWLVNLVDISDLRHAMAQRDQAMHFISHDIRAPIGAILTVIEMDKHFGAQAGTSPQLLERIQRYARNGLSLAEDFVHLAHAQNTTAQRVPVELQTLFQHALDDTWAAALERKVELAWRAQPEEAWVLGDASMLRRACANLISNAIKYGPQQGTVHCSLRAAGDQWCITVRDEGDGISEQEQARLFAPFARQKQHEASRKPGIGLGLAYVHIVAMQHGGSISVHSEVGHGASFILRLPQAPAPSQA